MSIFREPSCRSLPAGESSPTAVRLKAVSYGGIGAPALVLLLFLTSAVAQTDEFDDAELIDRGRYLAIAGDCAACHTSDSDRPFAGGYPMEMPMLGTIYSSNITPDAEHGIGDWSLREFEGALRRGVSKGGRNLYPAMPYISYARITDRDIRALYAYFMHGVEPQAEPNRNNDIPWLLSARWPLKAWNTLYLESGPYEVDPDRGEAWNRGAYLVQGLAHCGTCHTPRGIGFQEKSLSEQGNHYLAGGPVLAGWQAYNITPDDDSGIGLWTEAQLIQFLKSGHVNRLAQAGGPMAEAVENSLARLRDEDIHAIATYLRAIPAVRSDGGGPRQRQGQPSQSVIALRGKPLASDIGEDVDGARLYLGLCASCHGADGTGSEDGYYPSLVHNSTVGAHSDHNLRQAILHGVRRDIGQGEILMPGFARQLSGEQLAALVDYLRQQFGGRRGPDAPDRAAP